MLNNLRILSRTPSVIKHHQLATFAAGCFWSAQLHFQCVTGVISTQVGFINGRTHEPTFEEVCADTTGHALAVQITFDYTAVSYEDLLEYFWAIQSSYEGLDDMDLGSPHRSGIYFHSDAQHATAVASKSKQEALLARDIWTEIAPAGVFYPADDYHQRYLEKGGHCVHDNKHPCSGSL
ncbi:peptide-methionine (S)-S-oxide reductase [Aphanomyces astaci]|uniref:peptide-methionine (S)-S-oxide reductase n=1 Tax=Aphanomyces astaci TaxID=112090 RepID=W4HBU9_APHAT|nr:peptide-methionine (S)-S-oxide reductase [Aphanomyces astaci]ETV88754.1 peptide-methionine (S)-S-oxide reductase [Aphanomyces astaci]RQM24567.1 hypothetical protein B5M09_004598 [Aphanomyces astaci]|eukprot:XP_009821154.1 peptide-methionine (S)-S-oxide reductase [Aphanomyces astaci]